MTTNLGMTTYNEGNRGSEYKLSTIGDRMRARREQKGWTQKKVAERLNLLPTAYANYENGSRGIRADMVKDIATALECTTNYLLGEVDNPEETVYDEVSKFTDAEIQFLRSMRFTDEELSRLTREEFIQIQNFIDYQVKKHLLKEIEQK